MQNSESSFSRIKRKLFPALFNNIFFNRLLIWSGEDDWIKNFTGNWDSKKFDSSKSLAENAGFSHYPEIEASRKGLHEIIRRISVNHLKEGDQILDVGCGVGLYLKPLQHAFKVTGIDLSKSFLEKAKELIPKGNFILGNYLDVKLENRFHFIFSISSLEYFVPSQLDRLLGKFHHDLEPGGVLLIQYPHALSVWDLLYHDLTYIRYSPRAIENTAKKYFSILEHHHYIDSRKVNRFDSKHYYFPDETKHSTCTNLNSYLLIAQKS